MKKVKRKRSKFALLLDEVYGAQADLDVALLHLLDAYEAGGGTAKQRADARDALGIGEEL